MPTVTEVLAQGWQVHQAGRLQEAEGVYRQVLTVQPENAEAWCYLGMACHDQRRHAEAEAAYRRALQIKPAFPVVYNNLANTLTALGRFDEAVTSCEQALWLKPDYANAFNNLGTAYYRWGRFQEAVGKLQRALTLKPDHAEALNNLGAVQLGLGQLDAAQASFERAMAARAGYPEAHKNRAMLLLLAGNFAEGWDEYEWRWQCDDLPLPAFDRPMWDGSPLDGRRLLLYAEQGLGDTLQFVRYAALLQERGGHVIVACQPPLAELLKSCAGIDELVTQKQNLPPHDLYVPLLSVPKRLHTSLDSIPARIPYLHADERLVEHWRQELAAREAAGDSLKIGIAWQGSRTYQADHLRSIPLAHFEPLARVEGVRLFSLQKGYGSEQLSPLAGRLNISDFGGRLDESTGPFLDTAAVMKNLDLVITADTVVGHLAGALGVPVWIALCSSPDWRWLLGRDDSPWYPTARLFRQETPGDWSSVFRRMAEALGSGVRRSKFKIDPAGSILNFERLTPSPTPNVSASTAVETSLGELVDKLTILEIKSVRITDPAKLANVHRELETLRVALAAALGPQAASAALDDLTSQLKAVNEQLWQIEDEIRDCERAQNFGPPFVKLARSVYRQNDRRAALKRRINKLCGSRLVEEKSYRDYEHPAERFDPRERRLLSTGFNCLTQGRHGYLVYNQHDMYIGRSVEHYGEFSEGEIAVFRQLIRPGDCVVEAGANIGTHTLAFAELVGPRGTVLAFEPQRIVFQTLCANVALNSVQNVFCRYEALGARPGSIVVPRLDYNAENNFGGLGLGQYSEGEPTPVITLDSLALPRLNFLKIDVEGMELSVLQGARETIYRHLPLLYIENDRPDKSAALIEFLLGLGYRLYWHTPPMFNADNYFANRHNVLGNIVSVNMLGVPSSVKSSITGLRPIDGPESRWR